MAVLKSRSVLGIEIHPDEIRVVELVPGGAGWAVSKRFVYSPAPNFLGEVGFTDPLGMGRSLRNALDKAGIAATDAVFGLPPNYCAIRALSVPPVEGAELRFIVQGEIELARMFHTPDASFDLVQLNDAKLLDSGGRSVLAVGAEVAVLANIRDFATSAGLQTEGIEPIHMALFRGAYVQAPPPNLFLTLSESYAELSLLDGGRLALHRAFDLGASIFDPALADGATRREQLDLDAAGAIAIELRRTIDFIARELPDAPPTEEIAIAATHPSAPLLVDWLQNSLRIRCRLADLNGAKIEGLSGLPPAEALKYSGAFALTLRPPVPLPEAVPVVDLLAHEKLRHNIQEDIKRKSRVALLAACAILACSLLAAGLGTLQANRAAGELAASKARLAQTQELERMKKQEAAQKAERLALLSAQGVSVSGLVRSIVRTLSPNVGLTDIAMTADGATISGEALSETAIIAMSDALRKDPRFLTVSVSSFERIDPEDPSEGIRFRMAVVVPKALPPVTTPPAEAKS